MNSDKIPPSPTSPSVGSAAHLKTCQHCEMQFNGPHLKEFISHMADNRCGTCKRKFGCRTELKIHLKNYNHRKAPLKTCTAPRQLNKSKGKACSMHCRHCAFYIKTTRQLLRHQFLTNCNTCRRRYRCATQLARHVKRSHSRKSGRKVVKKTLNFCDQCGEERHLQRVQPCSVCPETFRCPASLRKHKEGAHFRCHSCQKLFLKDADLQAHLKRDCVLCGRRLKCETRLKRHMKKHPQTSAEAQNEIMDAIRSEQAVLVEDNEEQIIPPCIKVEKEEILHEMETVCKVEVAIEQTSSKRDSVLAMLENDIEMVVEKGGIVASSPVLKPKKFVQQLIELIAIGMSEFELKKAVAELLLQDLVKKME
ncbi:PR domain zinc finger protein 15-like [Neocloeon triangulifer]|uniref:PR domain zinc finger protein 15-like n=1 Tax=Neocloeon triangulifer TaxID=2078957 RepID=UPI00286F1785|nr:PR domain zinc finger protein 15-like [Neocloeon triangulifer]